MREGWKLYKLIDLADMRLGKMLDQKKNKGEFYDYLANVNVQWGKIDLDNLKKMKFESKEFDRYGLNEGDIVMCEGGEPGRCAIWKGQRDVMMIQKALHRIRTKEKVDSYFLYYNLLYKGLNGYFDGYFTGSTIKHFTGENLARLTIKIPPLKTQRKIASILSAYDDLIENNLKRIKLLEEQAQQTYEEWFVRFKFPGYEDVEIDEISGLPEGWENRDLNYLCDKVTDGTHATPKQVEEGYKLITGKHIGEGFINFESAYLISEDDHFSIRKRSGLAKGDILFSNIGTLGNIAVVTEDFEYSCKNVIIFKKKDFFQNYLYCYLTNTNTKNKLDNQSSGVAQKFYSLTFIRNFKDNFPNEELVQAFDKIVSPLFKLKYNLFHQNQLLKEARDILLPRLMSGMIDVDDLEIDANFGPVSYRKVAEGSEAYAIKK